MKDQILSHVIAYDLVSFAEPKRKIDGVSREEVGYDDPP